jgi:hypothetical protein
MLLIAVVLNNSKKHGLAAWEIVKEDSIYCKLQNGRQDQDAGVIYREMLSIGS